MTKTPLPSSFSILFLLLKQAPILVPLFDQHWFGSCVFLALVVLLVYPWSQLNIGNNRERG